MNVRRYLHTVVQLEAVILIAWAVARLTHDIAWGGLTLGVFVLVWSVLAELSASVRKRSTGPDLRNVA